MISITLVQAATDTERGNLFFLSGLLMVIGPIIALGVPLWSLRGLPRGERRARLTGMLAVGIPALIVFVVVATLIAPSWSERNYIETAHTIAEHQREAPSLSLIISQTLILTIGSGFLIWLGGYVSHRLQKDNDA